MHSPTFTIFIPTYNRVHLLPRAFASIESQTFKDFDVLIVDDGSNDDTQQTVSAWSQRVDFSVQYIKQENQGKPAAHNAALNHAYGYFTVILDSDDMLASNALQQLHYHWRAIPDNEKPHFAGVEGLCALFDSKKISGDKFPQDVLDSDYLETRHRLHIGGDKKNAIRTDILKAFPFPRFEEEKHIRESVVWNRIARHYKFRYINEIIQYIEYQPDGLSTGIFWRRVNNPQGFLLAHQEMVNDFSHYLTTKERYREMVKYVRFSRHCHHSLITQQRNIKDKRLWLLAQLEGNIAYFRDQIKIKNQHQPRSQQ